MLVWLLWPANARGVGERFLQWFVNHVNEPLAAGSVESLPAAEFGAKNVAVWRERDCVGIAIEFEKEQCLIAVENKGGPVTPDHVDQVRRHRRNLSQKHEGHTVTSVPLTTSPEEAWTFQLPRQDWVGRDAIESLEGGWRGKASGPLGW